MTDLMHRHGQGHRKKRSEKLSEKLYNFFDIRLIIRITLWYNNSLRVMRFLRMTVAMGKMELYSSFRSSNIRQK